MIVIKGKTLLFDNYTWFEWVKRVDWDNIPGSGNIAAVYAAMASSAYSAGEEKPEWKDATAFYRTFSDAEKKKLKDAFEGMNEYLNFVDSMKKEIDEGAPVERKKKPLKTTGKT